MARRKQEGEKPRRRPKGLGTVYQRKDGRWAADFIVEATGKKKTIYGKTEKETHEKLQKAIAEAERGSLASNARLTVGQYMQEYLETRELDTRANTQHNWDFTTRKYIIPRLGRIPLQKLTRGQVQAWITGLSSQGLVASSVQSHFVPLRAAMTHAVKTRLIHDNPCQYITQPTIKRADKDILTPEQAYRFVEYLEGHWLKDMVVLGVATGMRKSELIALRWSDIDLERKTLRVQHNVAQIPGGGTTEIVEGPPKTEAGERTIGLPKFALDMLKDHRIAQIEMRLLAGSEWQDLDLVFCREKGDFIRKCAVNQSMTALLKKAGLPHVTPHSLRSLNASALLSKRILPKVVQERLGHSSIKMTMDLYGKSFPIDHENAVRELDTTFSFDQEKEG